MLLRQALTLHQRGRLAEAASLYRQIPAADPCHADALNLLGVIHLQEKMPDDALAFFDRAIALDSSRAAFFCNRGVALQDLKRFEEALEAYDRALAIRADNPEAFNNRGTVLRELKRFEEALQSYERALALRPNYAEAHNNRGNVLGDLKQFEQAIVSYNSALAAFPAYADALANRGNAFRELRRHDEALASFDAAIAIRPTDPELHRHRGIVLRQLRRLPEAVASLQKALALGEDAQTHNHLANTLSEQGRLDEAVVHYERALSLNPELVEAHLNLALIFKIKGSLDAAIAQYRMAIARRPSLVETHLLLGEMLLEQGRFDEAAQTAEAAAMLASPSFPHFAVGVLFARCGRERDARHHLLRAQALNPDDRDGAGMVLARLGFVPPPDRASSALLRKLYAERAKRWSAANTTYRGHRLVAETVKAVCGKNARLDILDAGCGTGLLASELKEVAGRLDGVDLSPEMLAMAKGTHLYDALQEGDLVKFLRARRAAYDVVASAATLIHFGDLKPVFEAAATALRPRGLFVFTLFPNSNESAGREVDVAPLGGLGEGGCFVHGKSYVTRLANETGFSILLMETHIHEEDNHGRPVHGLVVALRRTDRPGNGAPGSSKRRRRFMLG